MHSYLILTWEDVKELASSSVGRTKVCGELLSKILWMALLHLRTPRARFKLNKTRQRPGTNQTMLPATMQTTFLDGLYDDWWLLASSHLASPSSPRRRLRRRRRRRRSPAEFCCHLMFDDRFDYILCATPRSILANWMGNNGKNGLSKFQHS